MAGEKEKYLVVPDYWKVTWGERPLLGIVYASDHFEGERQAYEKGLLPMNITFKPMLIKSKNQGAPRPKVSPGYKGKNPNPNYKGKRKTEA